MFTLSTGSNDCFSLIVSTTGCATMLYSSAKSGESVSWMSDLTIIETRFERAQISTCKAMNGE